MSVSPQKDNIFIISMCCVRSVPIWLFHSSIAAPI